MRNLVLMTLSLLIFNGCTSKTVVKPKSAPPVVEKKLDPKPKTRALFHVIEPLGVQLVLLNMDKNKEEIVLIDKTLSELKITPGFWQVNGFILDGKRYKVMNTSKQFVFKIKKNQLTYVGSYIFQCPKVNHAHMAQMKKMSFFNRYPFSSQQRLCEMVVGSDFDNVNRVYLELEGRQQTPLSLGF